MNTPAEARNVYLVGMPGAGKTTIGRQLARRLGRTFRDLDHEIEASTGVGIPIIFEFEGESGFRKRESEMLALLASASGQVVATGGGAVLRPENREAMKRSGVVVYLSAEPAVLYERTRLDQNRPLLRVENPMQTLVNLHEQRDPLYREVADLVISAPGGHPGRLVRRLEKELGERCAS